MADQNLPIPATVGEIYLKAILDELRAMRAEQSARLLPSGPEFLMVKEPGLPPADEVEKPKRGGKR